MCQHCYELGLYEADAKSKRIIMVYLFRNVRTKNSQKVVADSIPEAWKRLEELVGDTEDWEFGGDAEDV